MEVKDCKCLKTFGGPGEIRTHDLFHAMEARSQLRHRPSVDCLPMQHITLIGLRSRFGQYRFQLH
jgi:hypothetical protein